jgi:hypothetical protein
VHLDLSGTAAVVLDVDGTIAGPDHRITARTSAAMHDLERAGVPVVLATGRSRSGTLDIARGAGLRTPVVSNNGAVVTDPGSGRDLRVRTMAAEEVAGMVAVHRRTGRDLTWWTTGGIFATSPALRDTLRRLGDPGVHLARPPDRMPDDVVKVMVSGTREQLDAAEPWVRRLSPRATRSMDEFWELSAPDATKWSGVAFVFDLLRIDPARAAGLGDGGNDVVWMRRIGTPVAMGNARPEVRGVARAVVGHHGEEGAAAFLEQVLRAVPPAGPARPRP